MIKSIKIDEETDNEYICYDYEDCRLEQLIDKPNNRKIYDDLVNEVFEHLVIKKHNLNITSEVGMIKKIYKFYYKDIFVGIIGIKDYERTFGVKIKKEFQNTGIAKVALDFTLSVLNVNYIYGYVLNNNRNIIFFNTILSPILFDANKEYSKTRYMRFAI